MKKLLALITIAFYIAWNYQRNVPDSMENDDDLTNDWFI